MKDEALLATICQQIVNALSMVSGNEASANLKLRTCNRQLLRALDWCLRGIEQPTRMKAGEGKSS